MKMILFDIDGTLLLTGGAGKAAFQRTFRDLFGVRDAWGDLVPDGKTDPVIIEEIAGRVLKRPPDSGEYEKICEAYLKYFSEEIHRSRRFRVMPGVQDLLGKLSQNSHFLLGLATGNFEPVAMMKLERAGLHRFFVFGGYGSDAKNRSELTRQAVQRGERIRQDSFRPCEIFLVGDTIYDILAGKELGVQTIAVATGSTPHAELASHTPDFFFPDLLDSVRFMEIVSG